MQSLLALFPQSPNSTGLRAPVMESRAVCTSDVECACPFFAEAAAAESVVTQPDSSLEAGEPPRPRRRRVEKPSPYSNLGHRVGQQLFGQNQDVRLVQSPGEKVDPLRSHSFDVHQAKLTDIAKHCLAGGVRMIWSGTDAYMPFTKILVTAGSGCGLRRRPMVRKWHSENFLIPTDTISVTCFFRQSILSSPVIGMRFASSITAKTDPGAAVDELLAPLDARVTPGDVDLALFFITNHYDDDLDLILDRMSQVLPHALLLGCTAEGTIGVDKELERTASMSLLVASLPDVDIRPFHLQQSQLESAKTADDWERLVGVSPESKPTFICLADPFSIAIYDFLDQINANYPQCPVVGGIASAGRAPRQNRLVLGGAVHQEGMVGVALAGNLHVETVVSQGCRPIGKSFIVTKAEGNIVHELGRKPALEQLHSVLSKLDKSEELLARESMFLGRAIDEYKGRFGRGDFLIHNILGADRKSGAIGIAGQVKVGTTVQFHVRDAQSADEDLRAMLSPHTATEPEGALLFGCNGRGTHMWPQPGHDIGVIRNLLGNVPIAGFFCGGEFGPVGGRNFVHGFTASIALFHPPSAATEA
jgi:small ligand-binding sensory domain FIST